MYSTDPSKAGTVSFDQKYLSKVHGPMMQFSVDPNDPTAEVLFTVEDYQGWVGHESVYQGKATLDIDHSNRTLGYLSTSDVILPTGFSDDDTELGQAKLSQSEAGMLDSYTADMTLAEPGKGLYHQVDPYFDTDFRIITFKTKGLSGGGSIHTPSSIAAHELQHVQHFRKGVTEEIKEDSKKKYMDQKIEVGAFMRQAADDFRRSPYHLEPNDGNVIAPIDIDAFLEWLEITKPQNWENIRETIRTYQNDETWGEEIINTIRYRISTNSDYSSDVISIA